MYERHNMKDKNVVLFVDDEISVLNSLKRGLMDENFISVFASSGEEALRIMEKRVISVIVSDMRMPGMNGLTLLKIVRNMYPNTVRVVLSGYTQLQQVLATVNQVDIFKFITKPWKLNEEFIPIIYQSIDYYEMQMERIQLRESLKARNVTYQKILHTMQEKLNIENKNYHIIQRAFEYFTDFIDQSSKGQSVRQKKYLKAKNIFMLFLETFQGTFEEISINQLEEQIQKFLLEMNEKNSVSIKNEFQDSTYYFLNIRSIYYSIRIIIELVMSREKAYFIDINTSISKAEEDFITFDFRISSKSIIESFEYYQENHQIFNFACEIFNLIGISCDAAEEDSGITCKISGIV